MQGPGVKHFNLVYLRIQVWSVRLTVLLWLTFLRSLTLNLHLILKNKQGSRNSTWTMLKGLK